LLHDPTLEGLILKVIRLLKSCQVTKIKKNQHRKGPWILTDPIINFQIKNRTSQKKNDKCQENKMLGKDSKTFDNTNHGNANQKKKLLIPGKTHQGQEKFYRN
jgi:hypothetical protein